MVNAMHVNNVPFLAMFLVSVAVRAATSAQQPELPPNIVIVLVDDLGYGDIRPFGEPAYATPHLDAMAREGRAFTDFLVPSAVCSASRAALLTGCYPERVGIRGALGPDAAIGLHESETTLAELCKSRGYATALIGKWHLGHRPPFLPLHHGFDRYYGLPYSNDMWPLHPDFARLPPDSEERKRGYPDLPLLEGNDILIPAVDASGQRRLTADYTARAVDFIRANKDRPFFLYLAHAMVHVPLFVSERFEGRSGTGLFGDVMQEVDWSIGCVLTALREWGLDRRTLVVFTSDNGPWLSYGNHAGSAGPLREGKGTSFEGGVRVPTLMWWPGTVPAGTRCDELASTIDLLPTVAALIEAERPDRAIDGKDIRALLWGGTDALSPHEAFLIYYADGELQAVRDRRWKLVLPHRYRTLHGRPGGRDGSPAPYEHAETGITLFDLKVDPGETTDVSPAWPDVRQRLAEAADRARHELGDSLTQHPGTARRPAGRASAN